MVDQVVQEVIKHWISIGTEPLEGANASTIAATEAYFDISLGGELLDFYSSVNGIFDEDDNGFAFYSLQKWRAHTAVFKSDVLGFFDQRKVCIIFVDYLQASWYYALLFDRNTDKYTIGILPHQALFIPITDSFNEFLKWYLKDDEMLYNVD